MRSKNLLIGLAFLVILVVVLSLSTKSQKPEQQADFEIIEIGTGGSPHWSPDGSKLAYVYKNALYIANADGTGDRLKVAELPKWTWGFIWVDSAEFILHEFERHRIEKKGLQEFVRIKKLTMDGKIEPIVEAQIYKDNLMMTPQITPPMVLNDGTVGYYEIPVLEGRTTLDAEKTFRIIKPGKLAPDSALKKMRVTIIGPSPALQGDIQLESIDGTVKKKITSGKSYSFPELSPDGTKILANLYVVDLEGNETRVAERGVDTADISESPLGGKWSPDSKKIAYVRQTVKILDEDGQVIQPIAGEIHIVNADGSGRQVIDIPDMIEANPVWSPDGTKIACGSHSSSGIFVIKLGQK